MRREAPRVGDEVTGKELGKEDATRMPAVPLGEALSQLDPGDPRYAIDAVERILGEAQRAGASDVHFQPGADGLELRLSTFPTIFGEKAVVRMFAAAGRFLRLDDLGLPEEVRSGLSLLLEETSGAIVLSGPAGSGKTTTIYACLRELAARRPGE